jgi:hypothetical protein
MEHLVGLQIRFSHCLCLQNLVQSSILRRYPELITLYHLHSRASMLTYTSSNKTSDVARQTHQITFPRHTTKNRPPQILIVPQRIKILPRILHQEHLRPGLSKPAPREEIRVPQSIRSNVNRLRTAVILDGHEGDRIRGLREAELDGSESDSRHAKGGHGIREVVQNAVPGIADDDVFGEAEVSESGIVGLASVSEPEVSVLPGQEDILGCCVL